MDCSACDQGSKEYHGCEKPSENTCWEYDGMQFHRCPMLWLNNAYSILNWYSEYHSCKEGLCAPPEYNARQSRWYEAEKTYSNAIAKIQLLTAEQPKQKKTEDGLKALRFGLEKRKKSA